MGTRECHFMLETSYEYTSIRTERRIVMFCRNCGAEIKDNAFMCVNCGAQTAERLVPSFHRFDKGGLSKSEVTLPCPLSPLQIDERMLNLSKYGLLFEVVGRNVLSDGFEYSLTANMGICSWGELLYVRCTDSKCGTMVNIFSKCAFPLQIFAWGKHERNIEKIKFALDMN